MFPVISFDHITELNGLRLSQKPFFAASFPEFGLTEVRGLFAARPTLIWGC